MSTLSVTRIENVQDFDFANTQFVSAYATANAAYSTANTKLPLSGGTITGDLVVTGNATFSGVTTYANTQTLLIGDSLFTLNADLPASVAATENAGMEVNRGLYGNSSIIWDETTDAWNVRVNNNTYMTITEAGDVGVGISTGITRKFMVNGDLDNAVKMAVRNNANSNNAFTQFTVESNNNNLYAYSFPTNYLTSGRYIAGSGVIEGTGVAGLNFSSTSSTGNIAFWTGASPTEKMRISSAGDVGVGTTSPIYKLDVNGSANISNATLIVAGSNVVSTLASSFNTTNVAFNTANAAFASANNVAPQVTPAYNTANLAYALANTIFASSNADYVVSNSAFAKANSALANTADVTFAGRFNIPERLLVTQSTSGTNGILVNMPTGAETTASGLRVKGYSPAIELMDKDSIQNWYMGIDDNDSNKLIFGRGYGPGQGVTQAITVDTSDNVGIGTASPSQKLQVYSASSDAVSLTTGGTGFAGYCVVNGNGRSGLTGGLKMFSYSAGTAEITNDSNMPLVFGTNAVERMRIDATGRVGIGASPAFKLDVSGNTRIGYQVTQGNPGTTDITTNAAALISGTGGNYLAFGQYDGTGSYAQWIQSSYQNPTTATYNLVLNPLGGNVGIGTAPAVSLDVGGRTDAIRLPVGTTAQRPAGANGHIRFNSTTSFYEIYDGPSSSWQSLLSRYNITYMIVAGGGGGGSAGGGGGGGYIAGTTTIAPATSLAVTVGAGGNPATTSSAQGGDGGSSSLGSLGTAIGGGGGGSYSGSPTGRSGGSGGGAGWPGSVSGGSGTAGQGNAGGSNSNAATPYTTGGGGGAAAVGGNNTGTTSSGSGGAGIINSINGSSLYWAGGGGGGAQGGTSAAGNGGIGGGGGGANYAGGSAGTGGGSALNSGGNGVLSSTQSACVGGSGGTNTGGGGGGMGISVQTGGTGGSGIVIISYPGPQRGSGGTVTSSGGNTIHTFTTSGTFIG